MYGNILGFEHNTTNGSKYAKNGKNTNSEITACTYIYYFDALNVTIGFFSVHTFNVYSNIKQYTPESYMHLTRWFIIPLLLLPSRYYSAA
jgi:hypothetical protein